MEDNYTQGISHNKIFVRPDFPLVLHCWIEWFPVVGQFVFFISIWMISCCRTIYIFHFRSISLEVLDKSRRHATSTIQPFFFINHLYRIFGVNQYEKVDDPHKYIRAWIWRWHWWGLSSMKEWMSRQGRNSHLTQWRGVCWW